MIVSEQSTPLQPEEPPPLPADPSAVPTTAPAMGTLKPSPFLSGFDWVLAVGALVLGLGVASFAVRNSDFWFHLGTGRLIAKGQYQFGKDPFSYTTADRAWINHSWLYDLLTYGLYSTHVAAVVVFKAVVVAGVVLLLLLTRRRSDSLWPGVLCAGLALLAAAPHFTMQPQILSYLFLAFTVYALVMMPAKAGSWRLPIALGVTFWLWSNCDRWFIIGPAIVALYLVGEAIRQKLRQPTEGEERPALGWLAIALVVGVAACMLNPHHVRVWRLPAELLPSSDLSALAKEAEFQALFRSGIERGSFQLEGEGDGNPVNAYAFGLLVVLNLLGFVLNFRKCSLGLLAVNAGLLGLAIVNVAGVPFYVLAAAPATALNFGAIADRARQRSYTPGTLQLLAGSRVLIRMSLLLAGLAAIVACYPGWLHPFREQRRLSLAVDSDPSLEKAARQLQEWRDDGTLTPQAHGLILNPELADYCAWFAPGEKTFFDRRLELHQPTTATYLRLRQQLMPVPPETPSARFQQPVIDIAWLRGFLGANHVTHVAVGTSSKQRNIYDFRLLIRSSTSGDRHFGLLRIIGATSLFGWRHQETISTESFTSMRYNPVRLAFDPNVPRLPDTSDLTPPTPRGFVDKFLFPAAFPAPSSTEAFLTNEYLNYVIERVEISQRESFARHREMVFRAFEVAPPPFQIMCPELLGMILPPPVEPRPAELWSASILSVRAARRAILESPQHPDGYLALAHAYNNSEFFPVTDGMLRDLVVTASLERYLARMTPEIQALNPRDVFGAAMVLVERYLPQQGAPASNELRFDLAVVALKKAINVLRSSPNILDRDRQNAELKRLENRLQLLEKSVRERENSWLNSTRSSPSPVHRALAAEQVGLHLRSLEELKKVDLSEKSKLPPDQWLLAIIETARLQTIVGQPEAAESLLSALEEKQADLLARPDLTALRERFNYLHASNLLILGRFQELIRLEENIGSTRSTVLEQFRNTGLLQAGGMSAARWMTAGLGWLPAQALLAESFRPQLALVIQAGLAQGFRGNPNHIPFIDLVMEQRYAQLVRSELNAHLRLGMNYLEQGDNRLAAQHFRLAARHGPHDKLTDTRVLAELYLRLLNRS
jgi:hypothetical protein